MCQRGCQGVCARGCVPEGVCVPEGGVPNGGVPNGGCQRGVLCDPTQYGQRVGGTHPTGMHSFL